MSYIHSLPASASFIGKGLSGYTFGPLKQKDCEIYYIKVEKGHDVFMISRKITRTYYVLSGVGQFIIDGQNYPVKEGVLVEVPPQIEYCYSGKMTLIAISRPRWFKDNDTFTKWNPDVFGHDAAFGPRPNPWLTKIVRARVFGKRPVNGYLRLNQKVWNSLPSFVTSLRPVRLYGNILHKIARMQGVRAQALATLFLRNRPQLELIRRLLPQVVKGGPLKVAVLGCSTGAEVYSVALTVRAARPDIKLRLNAVDISREAVEVAREGTYSPQKSRLSGTHVCETMTAIEIETLFDKDGDVLRVKPWIKEGICWRVGDAGEPEMLGVLGRQDIVLANNFLCHMEPAEAENCLRNIGRLVTPGGNLFVSGVDLDVRAAVARELGWEPLQELFEEIHYGDPYLGKYWPSQYAGLEPLDKRRRDWRIRYAAAFRLTGNEPLVNKESQEEFACDICGEV